MGGPAAEAQPSKVPGGAWITFGACMLLMQGAGTSYGFGLWSAALKESYGFEQSSIEALAVAGHVGTFIILDSGYLTSRLGAVFSMTVGCVYMAVGYFALWLAIAVFPGQFPFAALFRFCFVYGHGCGTIDNAVMTVMMGDFRDYKGNVNGCLKAYFGLATATVAVVYRPFSPRTTRSSSSSFWSTPWSVGCSWCP